MTKRNNALELDSHLLRYFTVTDYLCYIYLWICSVNHNPIRSSFMTYLRVCNNSNTTSVTIGAGTAYHSGAPEFTPGFQWGFVLLNL